MPGFPTNRRTCGAMAHHRALAERDEVYRANRRAIETFTAMARLAPPSVMRVPVVVHVLHHAAEENLPDEQVHSQIAVLNRDFRRRNTDVELVPSPFRRLVGDAMVEFQLATRDPDGRPTTGIVRVRTPVDRFDGSPVDLDFQVKSTTSGSAAWPRDRYLNLWVCHLGGGLLGYAQFPGGPAATDGVVIRHTAFGTLGAAAPPFDGGRTATHEVGHWLNLLHIWGDDGEACGGSDNVADTPNQAGPNEGKPSFPRLSCANGPHGDLFMNFMDYTDDAAMFMFTAGQVARMQATLRGPRSSLAGSDGLKPFASERIALTREDLAAVRSAVFPELERGVRVFDGVEWV